eukprot:136298_1
MAAPLRIENEPPKDMKHTAPPHPHYPMFGEPLPPPPYDPRLRPPGPPMPPPNMMQPSTFHTSGTSNEQLNIYLYPHQTLFTHNNYITYLSDKLTVEHLPPIQLPLAFNSTSTCVDYCFKCLTYCFFSLCKCGIGNVLSFANEDSNFYNTRIVINNNNIKQYIASTNAPPNIPYICLSPSLQISSAQSFGKRNFISPTHDSSSISSSLTRKILSINLTAQNSSSLVINIVNLFAYIINDTSIYTQFESAEHMTSNELLLDFASPITPYKLRVSPTYTNENNDRLLSSLERVLSSVTRFRNGNNNRNNRNNIAPPNNTQIRDLVSRRTSARAKWRKKIQRQMVKQRKGYCCVDMMRYLLLILSLALFPAVFILILMNNVLEQMSYDNALPISNTVCLVEIQCPHYRRRKKKRNRNKPHDINDDTIVFLESNGDIYHKYLGRGEKFYIRGECIIAFDKMLKKVSICNYGQNGTNMREYRCKGDFVEFIGPGHLWYGNGKQDLLSNSYKLKSILFCDNLKHADPNYIPNINDLQGQQRTNNANNRRNQMVGNYMNGRFGIIQSFELRQKYKIKFIEKCLIMSTITLVITSILLFVITVHLQPSFIDLLFTQINQFLEQFNLQ